VRGSLELSVGSKIQFVKFKAKTLFEFVQNSKNGVPFCWTTSFPDRKLISIHSKLVSFPWNIIKIICSWLILKDSGTTISRVNKITTWSKLVMSHNLWPSNDMSLLIWLVWYDSNETLVIIFIAVQRFNKISEISLFCSVIIEKLATFLVMDVGDEMCWWQFRDVDDRFHHIT